MVVGASVHNRTVKYFVDRIDILITYRDWRKDLSVKDREKEDRNWSEPIAPLIVSVFTEQP